MSSILDKELLTQFFTQCGVTEAYMSKAPEDSHRFYVLMSSNGNISKLHTLLSNYCTITYDVRVAFTYESPLFLNKRLVWLLGEWRDDA